MWWRRSAATVVGSAVLVMSAAVSATPVSAATSVYAGAASSGNAIVLYVSPSGLRLRGALIAWKAPCGDGATFPFRDTLKARVVRPSAGSEPPGDTIMLSTGAAGRIKGTLLQSGPLGDGTTAAVSMDIAGSLTRGGASGIIRGAVTIVRDTDGSTVTTCQTPKLKWTVAHHPGVVFGGLTSQGHPVAIRLKPDRRSVAEIDIGWSADCTPNGSLTVPEQFTSFPLSGGRFGDVFTVKLPSDGGDSVFDYNLSGKLTHSGGTGKFSARVAFPDGSTCQSSAGAWYVNGR